MGQPNTIQTIWLATVLLTLAVSTTFAAVDKDLILTSSQKKILDNFRDVVSPILTQEYMKGDIYLIRWLRARDFNIERSKAMLEDSLRWRKKNNMDGILDEDWSDYEARFKTDTEGFDKSGRPIYYVQLGSWDLRQAVLGGELDKVSRYLNKGIEKMLGDVRKLQAEGKNVTQYLFIGDIGGFSLTQHGCLNCIPVYVNFAASYELYYPGMANKILLVNSPSIFEVVLNAIRPVLSPGSREVLTVFGTNKQTYASKLFDEIDRSQLPPEVGGTKEIA